MIPPGFTVLDHACMSRAVDLAQKGWPAPNPRVGCVLVKEDAVIAEGWHDYAGAPHAEAMALQVAGEAARGSTAYVTLEPCSHFGRTPPCAHALVTAGVKRVVFAVQDPNPAAAGGAGVLQGAGILVQSGLMMKEAVWMNHAWLFQAAAGRPFIALKAAVTQDGYMARLDGTSKWITSPEARLKGHELRAEMGAVLVGRGTVQADDPLLTARFEGVVNQPRPIVLDPKAKLTGEESVLKREGALWIQAVENSDRRVRRVDAYENELSPADLMKLLRNEGVMGVLVEGGPSTLASFAKADLWDRLDIFIAPHSFGEGIPLNKVLYSLAIGQESLPVIRRSESQAGPDRHVTLWRESQIMGTIFSRLGSEHL